MLDPASYRIEIGLVFLLLLLVELYLVGGVYERRRLGISTPIGRQVAYWAALGSVLLALAGPIERFSLWLFWVHMVQHMILVTVTAPLLVLADPWLRLWRAIPLAARRPLARAFVRHPVTAPLRWMARYADDPVPVALAFAVNLWVWHMPALWNLTLRSHFVHHLEHTMFVALGLALWRLIIPGRFARRRPSPIQEVGLITSAMVASGVLGILFTFSTTAFFSYGALPFRVGGLDAATDQQIAGGIMLIPGSFTLTAALGVYLFRWASMELNDQEGRPPAAAERSVKIPSGSVEPGGKQSGPTAPGLG